MVSAALRRRLAIAVLLGLGAVGSASCAGSSVGDSLQQSLEADPQLEEQGTLFGNAGDSADETATSTGDEATNDESEAAARTTSSREGAILPPSERSRTATRRDDGEAMPSSPSVSLSTESTPSGSAPQNRIALGDVPEDLQPYVKDLMGLNFFTRAARQKEQTATASAMTFDPNQPITRGQYANWLLTANNLFYSDQPSQKIRLASGSATPAFQDVPASHPYFGAIQGLAEAGLIPSALTGNSTAVNFRPDAPLTRENLILWKVPLDIRTALPDATVDAVKATWGFQDAADIEPLALRAILADHQIGDFANILRAFGYTTLLQPQKAVTQAEAAATLWRFGTQTEGISAAELLNRPQTEAAN